PCCPPPLRPWALAEKSASANKNKTIRQNRNAFTVLISFFTVEKGPAHSRHRPLSPYPEAPAAPEGLRVRESGAHLSLAMVSHISACEEHFEFRVEGQKRAQQILFVPKEAEILEQLFRHFSGQKYIVDVDHHPGS